MPSFQKVNSLLDINDITQLLRNCFPTVRDSELTLEFQKKIIKGLDEDSRVGLEEIKLLPLNSKNRVYEADFFNGRLFKINCTPVEKSFSGRLRIPNWVELNASIHIYIANKPTMT